MFFFHKKISFDALPDSLHRSIAVYIVRHYIPENAAEAPQYGSSGDFADATPPAPAKKAKMALPQIASQYDEPDTLMESEPMECCAMAPMSLEALLEQTDAGFSQTLLELIDRTGKKDSEIYKKANISRKHFSKIRSDPQYSPSKSTVLSFAIALELDREDTQMLLSRAGYALSSSSKADIIISYFIEHNCYDIHTINQALYEFDQKLLGV